MFTSLCSKFIQETMCQISLELLEFCRRYYRKHFGLFFRTQCTINSNNFKIVNGGRNQTCIRSRMNDGSVFRVNKPHTDMVESRDIKIQNNAMGALQH